MRTIVASVVALVALGLMGIALVAQYGLTAAVNIGIQEQLSPVVDDSAALTLAQANASGALSDYVMLNRAASLDSYRQSIGQATTILADIAKSVADDPDLTAVVTKARTAQRAWVKADADPTIAYMEAGKPKRAMKQTGSDAAWSAYVDMTTASTALHDAANESRDQAIAAASTFTRLLGFTLLFVGICVLLGLAAFYTGLHLWVLAPLSTLRESMQRTTREPGHTDPVRAVGPPELRAVGVDAEHLRRELVREIDDARAAREGLVQDAPLVAAMQRELGGTGTQTIPGLVVDGSSQSAEGVVAGDWWDSIPRPDGTLALVVADVSGHGPQASVTALRVRSVLRSALVHGLPADEAVAMATESCADDTHFVTAIVIMIDVTAGTLSWCNAGHHPAIIVTHDKDAALCEPTGPLISSLGGEWSMRSQAFGAGDVVVAFTDGLVESRNAEGDELESSKVAQFIRGADAPVREQPAELIARLLAQVRHRAADWRRDDVTVVAAARPSH
jgi:serine phosphatase RsbU (regulator of sigma subunit)/CHASE3 domain sensor protein